ncbi:MULTISPECIES: exo-alpha-sialidase [unclassified Luteococcus]|uniref:exo-alpha-sialidase n=1 Tax=unclassified Luteococcus TaxID=2639923 RepID=UPI00313C81BB
MRAKKPAALLGGLVMAVGALGLAAPAAVAQADVDLTPDPFWAGTPNYTEQTLAMGGDGVFPNYRIPALAVTNRGTLLTSYDGRPTGIDAPGPNSILQRRSEDMGRTWQPTTAVHAGKTTAPVEGYSDPSYVIDRTTGEIFNFHVYSMDAGFIASQPGVDLQDRKVLHAEVSSSRDDGKTWTHRIITPDITPDLTVRSRFAASGQGIQLTQGPHAGRLLQQFTIRIASGDMQAVTIYSDDHGKTWQSGKPVGTRMDENKVVELSDGRVMLNSRDSGGSGYRKVAISEDGGVTYGEVRLERALPDPVNNGSIIRAFPNAAPGSPEAKVLLFSNAASKTSRAHGTVRASCDDGTTWPIAREFRAGAMAYSTLAVLPDGRIGLAYEPGHNGIIFAKFNLSWLRGMCTGIAPAGELTIERGGSATTSLRLTNQLGPVQKIHSVQIDAPAGWQTAVASVGQLQPGASVQTRVAVQVPAETKGGTYRLPVVVTDAQGRRATGTLVVKVPRLPSEIPGRIEVSGGTLTNPRASYRVGDRLSFSYTVKNVSDQTTTVSPTGNLRGLDPAVDAKNCRYRSLAAGAQYTCTSAYHLITQADLDAGSFTPATTWNSTSGEDLTTVELRGQTVTFG